MPYLFGSLLCADEETFCSNCGKNIPKGEKWVGAYNNLKGIPRYIFCKRCWGRLIKYNKSWEEISNIVERNIKAENLRMLENF